MPKLTHAHTFAAVLQFNPPLLLEYYEANVQMLWLLSWKPALGMPRYVKIQIFLF